TLIFKLSKGYRQRVGLAQALVHKPEVLILDEPTVGLDPGQVIEVRQLIKSFGGQHTVILSTHILSEASAVCGRVIIIHEGRIVAADTPENLTRRLRGSQRVLLVVRGPAEAVASLVRAVDGVVHVEASENRDGTASLVVDAVPDREVRESIANAVVNSGWGLRQLQSVSMSLEDVFLKLTRDEDNAEIGGR
ncbi:MAG: ATP-binding cassette domain-containing protein, partial [Armatimonadota bacterium]